MTSIFEDIFITLVREGRVGVVSTELAIQPTNIEITKEQSQALKALVDLYEDD